ncbi:MAG: PQQ-dependent sugar dehydrogenase, partial [Pseudomonadales bacterium]|nr:PQQ-dependent sugar dehydrogenase [Pseudomonadales bacterium]
MLLLAAVSANATQAYRIETVAQDLPQPWSLDFLPNGDFIIAMRVGELRIISADGSQQSQISGVPETLASGQGGFFDVLLDQNFPGNQKLYLSYAAGTKKSNATAVVSATLGAGILTDVVKIFEVEP